MLRRKFFWIAIYPIIAHIGLWISQPRLAIGYLVVLILFILLFPPRFAQFKNIVIASLMLVCILLLAKYEHDYMLIYLPPILIPGALMIVFLQSWQEGNIPLITKFAMKMEGDISDDRKLYTRRVTQVWTLVFALMVFEAIGLAIWTSLEVWSWFTHVGNYVVIFLVLIVEFIYRQYHFKKNNSFKHFISKLVQHRWM